MRFDRQMDLVSLEAMAVPITVIGVGGIGSRTMSCLADVGASNMTGYDDDVVEEENRAPQGYRACDIGKPKVVAKAEIIEMMTDLKITGKHERFGAQHVAEGIVISGVDSMKSRAEIWRAIKGKFGVKLYIDGRMLGEMYHIYSLNPISPREIKAYEATLFSDEDVEPVPCTSKATANTAWHIASEITNLVKMFSKGLKPPFHTMHDFASMTHFVREIQP